MPKATHTDPSGDYDKPRPATETMPGLAEHLEAETIPDPLDPETRYPSVWGDPELDRLWQDICNYRP